ncbi:hypothetical protein OIU76_010577 [Salix suchowensis]|nr:hypothetical protein OIU76_010577 [Salix suchowensis]
MDLSWVLHLQWQSTFHGCVGCFRWRKMHLPSMGLAGTGSRELSWMNIPLPGRRAEEPSTILSMHYLHCRRSMTLVKTPSSGSSGT